MNKRIYIKDWLLFKPYDSQTITDSYYLKLSNDVKQAITTNKQSFVLQIYLGKEEVNQLACFLTSYFEDIISGTNIWNSFISVHKRLYKKQLPFYNIDEYYEEEINVQDVSLLTWYFLNTIQEEKFIAPYNDFIVKTAEKVMDVFDKAWEYAPENEYLKSFYQIDIKEDDFYVARNLIDTILFNSYLFYTDTLFDLKEKELEIIEESKNDKEIMMFINENRDALLHKSHTRLLSLTGKEWVSEILGNNHPLSADFLNISKRIRGYFFYKGQDHKDIFLEHIASSKKFKLTKKSFDYSDNLKEIDTIIFMGIVKWKDEWWFSGIQFQAPFDPDLVLDEKNSLESRMAVNFLDHQKKEVDEMLEKQLKAFKNFNNGSQIAFIPSDKINDFYKAYTEFFNNSLNLSDKEIEEAHKRNRKDGFFGIEDNPENYSEVAETGLAFFNPKSGSEIALAVNSAFPLSNNPYFEEESSEDHIMRLLMDESLSTELVMYCIDNCKKELPFFNKGVGKMYLDDIDFLLRFWKKNNYHSIPSITFTGQDEK
ncbi:MAG: DUF3843 family protein [Bacteroidetes bacterium]|nr:DUF3843 family protein [Bacteroidota bacterium]HET6244464.1 DUF3843 family protein [Bacteroidia bacterium]